MARACCRARLLMVVHSFPRLSSRLLSNSQTGLGLIDSLLTHAHTTQRNTRLGKSRCWDWGQGWPGCLAKEGARADNKYTHRPYAPLIAVGAATGNPTWSGPSRPGLGTLYKLRLPSPKRRPSPISATFATNTSGTTMNSSAVWTYKHALPRPPGQPGENMFFILPPAPSGNERNSAHAWTTDQSRGTNNTIDDGSLPRVHFQSNNNFCMHSPGRPRYL